MSNLAEALREAHLGEDEPRPPEPGFVAALRTIDRAFARVESVAVTLVLFALILVGVYGALKRKYAPPSPYWADEVMKYMMFFVGLVGAALAAQSERLFNIDMFTRSLRVRGKLVVRILTAGFTIAICWMFFTASMFMRAQALMGETGELIAPKWGFLALPAAMLLIAFHMLLHIIIDVYYLSSGKTPPEFEIPELPQTQEAPGDAR